MLYLYLSSSILSCHSASYYIHSVNFLSSLCLPLASSQTPYDPVHYVHINLTYSTAPFTRQIHPTRAQTPSQLPSNPMKTMPPHATKSGYILESDDESDRLSNQHEVIKAAMGGTLLRTPLNFTSEPLRILDSGTADGQSKPQQQNPNPP